MKSTNSDKPFKINEKICWDYHNRTYTATVLTNDGTGGMVCVDKYGNKDSYERHWLWISSKSVCYREDLSISEVIEL